MRHHHKHHFFAEHAGIPLLEAMRGRARGFFSHRGFDVPVDDDGEGRGRRRMFESGELRLVVLLLIESEPRHGYDLIREIETRTGGAYAPSPGVIYPTLTMLEDLGHAAPREAEGAKKLYGITEAGSLFLAENRKQAEAALAKLDALRARSEAFDAGPVFRAMNNLKIVLRQQLSCRSNKETLFAVADIVDEAARKIERL
jgi:DNA-binding PadR family transcriptional regulator